MFCISTDFPLPVEPAIRLWGAFFVAKIADGTIFQAQRGDSILGWTTSMRPLSSIQFSMA